MPEERKSDEAIKPALSSHFARTLRHPKNQTEFSVLDLSSSFLTRAVKTIGRFLKYIGPSRRVKALEYQLPDSFHITAIVLLHLQFR
jgi:hypothetical protein